MTERDYSDLEKSHQFSVLSVPRIHLDVEGIPTVTSDEQVMKASKTCKLETLPAAANNTETT